MPDVAFATEFATVDNRSGKTFHILLSVLGRV
jgi:hypothetical protein